MGKIEIDTRDILEIEEKVGRPPIGKVMFRNMDMLYGETNNPNDDSIDAMDIRFYGDFRGGCISNDIRKPKKYIINKGATILFWKDGTKTIVKRNKDDEYNKRLGFLTAYFQKHSGLTKNQANKYLANLQDEEELANEFVKK